MINSNSLPLIAENVDDPVKQKEGVLTLPLGLEQPESQSTGEEGDQNKSNSTLSDSSSDNEAKESDELEGQNISNAEKSLNKTIDTSNTQKDVENCRCTAQMKVKGTPR